MNTEFQQLSTQRSALSTSWRTRGVSPRGATFVRRAYPGATSPAL